MYPEALRSDHGALAEQELSRGQPEAALAGLTSLVEGSDPDEPRLMRLLPLLTRANLESGDEGRAEEMVLESVERVRAQKNRLALAELLRVRGTLLAGRRRRADAERTFKESASIARSLRYPYAEARTLYEWGLMYTSGPNPQQGQDRFEEGAGIFRRLGARPYYDLVREAITEPDRIVCMV
jgi:tetratricopeptide (TPR) repeat protein